MYSAAKNNTCSRGQNIEIAGIPEKPNENVNDIVLNVLQKVSTNTKADDVDIVHRVGPVSQRNFSPRVSSLVGEKTRRVSSPPPAYLLPLRISQKFHSDLETGRRHFQTLFRIFKQKSPLAPQPAELMFEKG